MNNKPVMAQYGDNSTRMFTTGIGGNTTENASQSVLVNTNDEEYTVGEMINIIYRPMLVSFGTIGNTMSFIVLRKEGLKQLSTCAYLSLLALADIGMLWTGCFITWVGYVSKWNVTPYTWFGGFSCKIWYYTFFGFGHISTNTLTITSLEKFINIYFPIKAREICTVVTAKKVMAGIVLVFAVFDAPWLYMMDYDKDADECKPTSERAKKMSDIYKVADAVFYSYIPLSLMTVFNTAIIIKIVLARKQKSETKAGNSSLSKAGKGITVMLVGTSILFIVCTLPYAIMYNLNSDWTTWDYAIMILLMYSNHAFNIVVYSITNRRFRREMLKLCLCQKLGIVHPFEGSTVLGGTEINAIDRTVRN